jgi:hypothetical protein
MLGGFGLIVIFAAIVGLVLAVIRLAAARDRSSLLWGGLALAAGGGALVGSWRWMVSGIGSTDTDTGTLFAGFAVLVGPAIAILVILLGLGRLPPGRPKLRAPIAVRMSTAGGSESGRLRIDDETLRVATSGGELRLGRVDLARIDADGEVLRLKLRDGDELRLHVIEHDDPYRRRRLCDVLAATLRAPVAGARARRV